MLFPAVRGLALLFDQLAPLITAPSPVLLRFRLGGMLVTLAVLLVGW